MNDNDRALIHIPSDGEYIEILGHRIDGFDSFEAFCEHLKKFAEMEKTINRQKAEIERLKTKEKLLIENDVRNKYPNCVLVEKGRIYTRTLEDYDHLIGDISAEAVKEFAERLKKDKIKPEFPWDDFTVTEGMIDDLVKEFTEGKNDE